MFGFMEGHYETVWQGQILHAGNKMNVDIRRPVLPPETRSILASEGVGASQKARALQEKEYYEEKANYLVLTMHGEPMYLFYDKPNQDKAIGNRMLADDLERLTLHPNMQVNDLSWNEKVFRDTGYGRDGSISMY